MVREVNGEVRTDGHSAEAIRPERWAYASYTTGTSSIAAYIALILKLDPEGRYQQNGTKESARTETNRVLWQLSHLTQMTCGYTLWTISLTA